MLLSSKLNLNCISKVVKVTRGWGGRCRRYSWVGQFSSAMDWLYSSLASLPSNLQVFLFRGPPPPVCPPPSVLSPYVSRDQNGSSETKGTNSLGPGSSLPRLESPELRRLPPLGAPTQVWDRDTPAPALPPARGPAAPRPRPAPPRFT